MGVSLYTIPRYDRKRDHCLGKVQETGLIKDILEAAQEYEAYEIDVSTLKEIIGKHENSDDWNDHDDNLRDLKKLIKDKKDDEWLIFTMW